MAGKPGVNIPISVTGADAAQQELRETQAAAERLQQSGDQASAASGATDGVENIARGAEAAATAATSTATAESKLADAASELGKMVGGDSGIRKIIEGLGEIDGKALGAARSLLTSLSPAMGKTLEVGQNLLQTLGKNPAALIAFIGAGIGLTQLIRNFGEVAAEAERAEKAMENAARAAERVRAEAEERSPELRKDVANQLIEAGVDPAQTADVIRDIGEFAQVGVGEDLARAASVAKNLGLLNPSQTRQFLGGILVSGGDVPRFTTDQKENRAAVERLLQAGNTTTADQFLTNYLSVTGPSALRSARADEELDAPDRTATALRIVGRERDIPRDSLGLIRQVFSAAGGRGISAGVDAVGRDKLAEAGFTEADLVGLAREVAALAQELTTTFGREAAPGPRPTVINRTTNVHTAYSLPGGAGRGFLDPLLEPGGSLGGGE